MNIYFINAQQFDEAKEFNEQIYARAQALPAIAQLDQSSQPPNDEVII
jgi:hypothetical protein